MHFGPLARALAQCRFRRVFFAALTTAALGGLLPGGRNSIALAQQNTGTDFWLAFPANSTGADHIQISIVGTDATSGTVTYAPSSSCSPLTMPFGLVAPDYTQTIALPTAASTSAACSAEMRRANAIEHKGIHVAVNAGGSPVTVYGFSGAGSSADRSTDGFLALPVSALGTTH